MTAPHTPASVLRVARALWAAPILLLVAGAWLLKAPLDFQRTLSRGIEAEARVTDYHSSGRSDVTYDYISLAVTLPDGREIVQEKLSLPRGLSPLLENTETLPVRVLPESAQPIVIVGTGRPGEPFQIGVSQMRIMWVSAAMCLLGGFLLLWGVWAWNAYLAKNGDPGSAPAPVAASATA